MNRRSNTMKAKTLEHLMNGGGKQVGLSGLQDEINALQEAMAGHRRELNAMPAHREKLLLGDDPDAALDQMEMRERALYRHLEKGALQIAAIEQRITDLRNAAIQPTIDRHRQALTAASTEVEATVQAAMKANAAAVATFEAAAQELGRDNANKLLPLVHFGGVLNDECLEIWRWQLDDQNQRIAREQSRAGS
jgi:hypothetical protein